MTIGNRLVSESQLSPRDTVEVTEVSLVNNSTTVVELR